MYMKITSSEHVVYINCSKCQNKKPICVHKIAIVSLNNLSSHCGLVDARICVSDKDLPVLNRIDANVQYEKSERPIAILLQTLLHLVSRHSKVFLLRPSLFVRNSHKKTRWWASSLFFSSAATEKKYALWRTA